MKTILFLLCIFTSLSCTFSQARIDIAGGITQPLSDFGSRSVSNTQSYFASGLAVGSVRYTLYSKKNENQNFVNAIVQCPWISLKEGTHGVHLFAQYQLNTFQLDQSINEYVWTSLAPSASGITINNKTIAYINSVWMEHSLAIGIKYYLALGSVVHFYPVASVGLSYLTYPSFSFSFDEVNASTRSFTFDHSTENMLGICGNIGLGFEFNFKRWGIFTEATLHAFQNLKPQKVSIQGNDGSTAVLEKQNFTLASSNVQLGAFFILK